MHAAQLGGCNRLGLGDLQIADFDEQVPDLGKIGGIIALVLHGPVVSLADKGQFAFALDVNEGDVVDLEILHQLLSSLAGGRRPGLLFVAVHQDQTSAAQNDEREENKD